MRQYFLFVGKDITQVPMKEDGQQMADGMPSVNSIEHIKEQLLRDTTLRAELLLGPEVE